MINDKLQAEAKPEIDLSRFRANFVIDDNMLIPFEEEEWVNRTLQIGDQYFYVTEVFFDILISSFVKDVV
jgi:uncharacterized protein YcbX